MKRMGILILALAVVLPQTCSQAADDKALAMERREAQQQRQLKKSERSRRNSEVLRQFRSFSAGLKSEYQAKARDLDTGYRLQQTELRAQRQMKTAEAEAEMQKSISQLLLNPCTGEDQQHLEELRAEMKSYQDRMYEIRREAAQQEHGEFIAQETRKHELLTERDNRVLEKAGELGLRDKPEAILATAIGGSLTPAEERWNDSEKRDVERLYQGNLRQLAEFVNGRKIREWEINNAREDFELEWKRKAEMHELDVEQQYFGSLVLTGGEAQNRQDLANRLAELSKQSQMINIKYNALREKNRIRRSEERRKLVGR